MSDKTLSPAEIHALTVLARGSKHYRDSLTPGVHPIDMTLKITGRVIVGDDIATHTSATPDQDKLIAYLLDQIGPEWRDRIVAELPERFEAAGQKMPEATAESLAKATLMLAQLRTKKPCNRKGAVRGDLTAEAVEPVLVENVADHSFKPGFNATGMRLITFDEAKGNEEGEENGGQ